MKITKKIEKKKKVKQDDESYKCMTTICIHCDRRDEIPEELLNKHRKYKDILDQLSLPYDMEKE